MTYSILQVSQNPKTLKHVVAKSSPELHYNRGIALKYEEEFLAALTSFSTASSLDPTWTEPRHQTSHMLKYLQDIVTLSQLRGKLKPKKLSAMISSLDPSKQLGPYSGGQYNSPNGGSVNLSPVFVSDLTNGANSEKVSGCWQLPGNFLSSVTRNHLGDSRCGDLQ